jgi:ADP-heptose:LPS heptosyltransferase
MFRDEKDAPGTKTINCLVSDGGMGDLICSLVAVDYILRKYSWVNLLIWVPDYMLDFAKNVLPENAIVRNYTEAKKKYDDKRTGISTQWNGRHSPMRIHPVDYAFHIMLDEHVDYPEKNYLKIKADKIDITKFTLPEKYVVIGIGSVFKVKELPSETANEVAKFCIQKGYTPVFVGKEESEVGAGPDKGVKRANIVKGVDYSLGINLVNKTSLTELGKIIQGAKAYVGCDGGNVHIAGCTETPIVVGYTFIDGKAHNVPIRNNTLGYNCYVVEPDASLACRFCQTKMNFVYQHWFPNCYYKDFKCLDHMTPARFNAHLEKIL